MLKLLIKAYEVLPSSLPRCSPRSIIDLVIEVLNVYGPKVKYLQLERGLIHFMRWSSPEQFRAVIRALDRMRHFDQPYLIRAFTNQLILLGDVDGALNMLLRIPGVQYTEKNYFQVAWVNLLRMELDVPNKYQVRSNILAKVLEIGARPNVRVRNVILLNSIEAGDLRTARMSYIISRNYGLLPNAYTFCILLKGVEHGDDADTVQNIYMSAHELGFLPSNLRLAFTVLWAFARVAAREHSPDVFAQIQGTYCEFFDTSTLHNLGIPTTTSRSSKGEDEVAAQYALCVMLQAWLRQPRSYDVIPLYWRFWELVQAGDPYISSLAQTTHAFNSFLKACGRQQTTVHMCDVILQHMLTSDVAKPDDISWIKLRRSLWTPDVNGRCQEVNQWVRSYLGGMEREVASRITTTESLHAAEPQYVFEPQDFSQAQDAAIPGGFRLPSWEMSGDLDFVPAINHLSSPRPHLT